MPTYQRDGANWPHYRGVLVIECIVESREQRPSVNSKSS